MIVYEIRGNRMITYLWLCGKTELNGTSEGKEKKRKREELRARTHVLMFPLIERSSVPQTDGFVFHVEKLFMGFPTRPPCRYLSCLLFVTFLERCGRL